MMPSMGTVIPLTGTRMTNYPKEQDPLMVSHSGFRVILIKKEHTLLRDILNILILFKDWARALQLREDIKIKMLQSLICY